MLEGFTNSNGFCGYQFLLDSTKIFKKVGFCCSGRSIVDSGSWTIDKGSRIILESQGHALYFEIFQIDNWFFFVQETEKQKFIADVQLAMQRFANRKPMTVLGNIYSANYIIGVSLIEKYYVREADEEAGI